jgi:hypothetical protein
MFMEYSTGIAQSVQRRVGRPGFSSWYGEVKTGSGAHTVSYPIGTGVLSPEVKRPELKPTNHFHSVLRSRIVQLRLHAPIRLNGLMFN